MQINQGLRAAGVASVLSLMTGCTDSTDPIRVEQDYGNSVRHMIRSQLYDPQAATNPPVDPPKDLDGYKAFETLETYRKEVARPEDVERPINIQITE